MIAVMEAVLDEKISKKDKKALINSLFVIVFDGIYSNEGLLQNLINLIRISLFRLFYNDNEKYRILLKELTLVLKANNIQLL
jgi:predicted Co/Zn/Cd cation transporter (cation efflux family)